MFYEPTDFRFPIVDFQLMRRGIRLGKERLVMVELKVEEDKLTLEVKGWDKLWALKSRLEIPLEHIKDAHVDPKPAMGWFQGLKLVGADFPNVFRAGTFYQEGNLVFWDVRDPQKTIVIELADERFAKLIVEVDDPVAAVQTIRNALAPILDQYADAEAELENFLRPKLE
jgi:hypothetical protein